MRIAFLLPCLEPGRNGVGDYVRGLAAACAERGHECAFIALNDSFIAEPVERNGVESGHGEVLRLPVMLPWKKKRLLASKFLQRFQPDWVSLHYVPYGFHRKGLTPRLGSRVRALVSGTPVEVMFHEIWIGQHQSAGWKHRYWGLMQRWSVRLLLSALGPGVIHTTNATYAALFRLMGVEAQVLNMFGAIPIGTATVDLEMELSRLNPLSGTRAKWLVAGMFGTLHPEWSEEPLMGYLVEAARRLGRRLAFVSVGRIGRGEEIWTRMERAYPQVHFARLGEKGTEVVSALLSSFDFGIATSPWSLLGKSSTVAAMLEHGLPVIVNRDEIQYTGVSRYDPENELLIPMDRDLPNRICNGLPRGEPTSRLPAIAESFLRSLAEHLPDRRVARFATEAVPGNPAV